MLLISVALLSCPSPGNCAGLARTAELFSAVAPALCAPAVHWTPPDRLELAPLPAEVLAWLAPEAGPEAAADFARYLQRASDATYDALLAALERRRVLDGSEEMRLTPVARQRLLEALCEAPDARALAALERMPRITEPETRRRTRTEVLGAIGSAPAFEALLAIAEELDQAELEGETGREWCDAAAFALARNSEHYDSMRVRGRKASAPIARAYTRAIAFAGDPRGLAQLGDVLLRREACAPEALAAVRAVGCSDDPDENERVARLARGFLDRWEPETCQEAVLAIAALEDFESMPALCALLEDESVDLRTAAARALRTLSGLELPDQPEAWRAWMQIEERWVASELGRALTLLASDDAGQVIDGLRRVRGHRTLRPELEEALVGLLQHPDAKVRAHGCAALAELGGARAQEALEAALEDEPAVALAARRALDQLE